MGKEIEHTGIVFDIEGNRIDVSVVAEDACSSCKVNNACIISGNKEKTISVFSDLSHIFNIGEEVIVSIERGMGTMAIMLAYILPLFLLIASMIILSESGATEIFAGLASLGTVAVYYLILSKFRSKIDKEVVFKIRKI